MSTASLHEAAKEGSTEQVQKLINDGADVNAKEIGTGGWTPLHYAVHNGHQEVAQVLVANGADVNAMDSQGWTPLDVATDDAMRQILKGQE